MHCKELTIEKLIVQDPQSQSKIEITDSRIALYDRRGVARAWLELRGDWNDAPRFI